MSLQLRTPSIVRLLAFSACWIAGVAHADIYGELAALTRAGNPEQAIAQADAYLTSNPRDPQVRFLKGVAQSRAGDTQAATETFERLVEEYPELPEPYNNLAVIFAAQNQLDKARGALEMAVRNNPNYALAHENLGDIYARLAHNAYQHSLQLQPAATQQRGLSLKLSTLAAMLQPAQP